MLNMTVFFYKYQFLKVNSVWEMRLYFPPFLYIFDIILSIIYFPYKNSSSIQIKILPEILKN